MSINTNTIKAALKKHIGDHNWKRITKRKFKYDNVLVHEKNNLILNGDLNWRCFYDADNNFHDTVFVLDDGQKVVSASTAPWIPGNCFQVAMMYQESLDFFGFFVNFKPNFKEFPEEVEIYNDDIREYTIAGLEETFKKYGFVIASEMENYFSVCLDKEQSNFNSYQEFEDQIKSIFNEIGFVYSKKLEKQIFEEYGSKDEFVEEYISILSVEDINNIILGQGV